MLRSRALFFFGVFVFLLPLVSLAKFTPTNYNGSYWVTVKEGITVDKLMEVGGYARPGPCELHDRNFPNYRKKTTKVQIELITVGDITTADEALKILDDMGMRPADVFEILAFGGQYRNFRSGEPIVALGTMWRCQAADVFQAPFLWVGYQRSIDLVPAHFNWYGYYKLAAVRK